MEREVLDAYTQPLDQIHKIIASSTCTLYDLFSNSNFRQVFRSGDDSLIDFLIEEEQIVEMMSWVLTVKHMNDTNLKLMTTVIIRNLKESSETYCHLLSGKKKFISILQEFIDDEKFTQSPFNTNFIQIIENMTYSTKGEFIKNFPTLPVSLIYNISVLAYFHLFFNLASNYTICFGFNSSMIEMLLDQINATNQLQTILLLNRLVHLRSCFMAFDNQVIIKKLLNVATQKNETDVINSICYRIILEIKEISNKKEMFAETITEFMLNFDVETLEMKPSTGFALTLFHNYIPYFINQMLDRPNDVYFHLGVLSILKEMSDSQLIRMIIENRFIPKLIVAKHLARHNGFLTEFVLLLGSKTHLCPELQKQPWKNFYEKTLLKAKQMISEVPGIKKNTKQKIKKRDSLSYLKLLVSECEKESIKVKNITTHPILVPRTTLDLYEYDYSDGEDDYKPTYGMLICRQDEPVKFADQRYISRSQNWTEASSSGSDDDDTVYGNIIDNSMEMNQCMNIGNIFLYKSDSDDNFF